MRNHSHRSMNRLMREGGSCAPSLGRNPRGANQIEMNPASSSIPSDWYEEKSCSVAMNERNSSVQIAIISRGQMFAVRSNEHTIPAATAANSAPSSQRAQKMLGAYQ